MARPLRYTFILALVAMGTALAAVGGWRYARASAPVNGPIILISVDTLRADRLPAYGYRGGRAPALDALARDGVVFERAYSHASVTLPAHASMLSGRLPIDTGVRDNAGFAVRTEERMLAEMLRDRGYATGAVVSSYVLRRETGVDQGFTFFDDEMPGAGDTVVARLRRDGAESARVAEHWLAASGTSRAFLFLHLYDAHQASRNVAAAAGTEPYDLAVTQADDAVGRLTRYLRTHQLYDQSTIILVADHGEGLGEHGEQAHGLFVYEEVVRVPLIIKPAGGGGAGRRVASLVQHVDLVPTILDLANAPVPDNLRGRSLRPLLDGDGRFDHRHVYSEAFYPRHRLGWSALTSLTDGRYRYIKAPREELYDLQRDPEQRDNIAAIETGAVTTLRLELERLLSARDAGPPVEPAPDVQDRLAALGYVGGGASPNRSEEPADPKDKVEILESFRRATADAGAGRFEPAATGFRTVLESNPSDASAHAGAAGALLRLRRLDEAHQHAADAAALTSRSDRLRQANAYQLLARIALARRNAADARAYAALAMDADPAQPSATYVEARLLFDHGRFDEALPLFNQAIEDSRKAERPPIPDLHYYAGETFVRGKGLAEAEQAFLSELETFPPHVRARGGLAGVYYATDRVDLAFDALTELVRLSPTAEGYNLAARLWTAFGRPREAAAVRAEARRSADAAAAARSSAAHQ